VDTCFFILSDNLKCFLFLNYPFSFVLFIEWKEKEGDSILIKWNGVKIRDFDFCSVFKLYNDDSNKNYRLIIEKFILSYIIICFFCKVVFGYLSFIIIIVIKAKIITIVQSQL
jgi:hypothetical protein